MFYVAVGTNWCNAAPESWVDRSAKICRWPLSNVSKAIWLNLEPDDSWEWHELKYVLGPYKTFGAAKEAEMNAQFLTSDDEDSDDVEIVIPGNHIKTETKHKYQYDDADDDRDDDNGNELDINIEYEDKLENNNEKKPNHKVAATKRKTVRNRKKQLSKPLSNSKRIKKDLNATASEDPNVESSVNKKQQPFKKRKLASEEDIQLSPESLLKFIHSPNSQRDPIIAEPGSNSQWENQSNVDNLSDNSNIEDLLRSMNRKLDLVLGYLHHNEQLKGILTTTDQLPPFPLTTVEDFEKFCIDLKENDELRNQFTNKIIKIGGQTGENHLTNILVTTITNRLGKSLTWEGQRDTYGIKDTTFASIVLGILLQKHSEATHDVLKKCFSEWLRRSGDRYRYHFKLGRDS